MTHGWQSLVTAGQVVRGVCYASPIDFVGEPTRLTTIPPERVGLHGEYDYYGLAKRVQACFKERLGRLAAAKIVVKQRGAAVVLSGHLDSRALLEELVDLAMRTEGATQVEVCDLQLNDLRVPPGEVLQVA
jgi:hypothetical protein